MHETRAKEIRMKWRADNVEQKKRASTYILYGNHSNS